MCNSSFKLLYDGQCPFCRRESIGCSLHDRKGRLATEDISDPASVRKMTLTQDAVTG